MVGYSALGAEADTVVIKTEFTDMIKYAAQYIAVSSFDCHSVWWRLSTPLILLNDEQLLPNHTHNLVFCTQWVCRLDTLHFLPIFVKNTEPW